MHLIADGCDHSRGHRRVSGGSCLGCLQDAFVVLALSYCPRTDDVYLDTGNKSAASFGSVAPSALCELGLLIVSVPFVLLSRRTRRRSWAVVGLAAVVAAAGVILDEIAAVAQTDGGGPRVSECVCPANRPCWWPFSCRSELIGQSGSRENEPLAVPILRRRGLDLFTR
jgi:hypothetical protein